MRKVGASVGGPRRVLRISDSVAGAVDSQPAARTTIAATVESTGEKAVKSIASHRAPIQRVAGRVGVMGKKTLSMLINAGETAARVMR